MFLDREKVFANIDQNIQSHISKLQELVRQPSSSLENKGIRECASLVLRYFKDLGCKTSLVETTGNPVVYGRYYAGAKRTIVVYMMYDTMPADEEDWKVDPFAGTLVDQPPFGRCLVARGAMNTKGQLRAFLNACESIKATGQELPVNMILVAEGEEELGSRHLPEFIKKYEKELQEADLVFSPTCEQDPGGHVQQILGAKGIVYFELELDGSHWTKGPREFGIHGSLKACVDSPVWRMIQALSTMTSPDGNKVLIKNFYNNITVPNQEDLELLSRLEKVWTPEREKEAFGPYKINSFIDDSHGVEMLKKHFFSPTLNIDGIWGGYTGPEGKTLLPHKITLKMDVRLVPNMRVRDILPMIREHLDTHGFREIQIRELVGGYGWSRTSYKHPAAQALIRSYREFGKEPEILPTVSGSWPNSMFSQAPLNLAVVRGGLGHGALLHSPNE